MEYELNARAAELVAWTEEDAAELGIAAHTLSNGGRLLDFGVKAPGSLAAGLVLAEVAMADLGNVSIQAGEIDGYYWPHVLVTADHPVAACLFSQYAGWQISVDSFFAMASGPMRAATAKEELFSKLGYRESPDRIVGVLESSRLPDEAVFDKIAEAAHLEAADVELLVARTASLAGNLQVVARSIETALHKLLELGCDVRRIVAGMGSAPLPPVAADDMTGIGRTNDAILYGAQVTLWAKGDDASLAEIGPKVPSCASASFGKPFLEIFEEAGRDFYKVDRLLFSPAEVIFQNVETGKVHCFGRRAPHVLRASFGLPDR